MLISGFEPKRVSSNLKQHRNEIYRTACLRVITRVEWVCTGFPKMEHEIKYENITIRMEIVNIVVKMAIYCP